MEQGSSLQSAWAGCGEAPGSSPDLSPQSCSKPSTFSLPSVSWACWGGLARPCCSCGWVMGWGWQGLQERISKAVRSTHWQLGKSAQGEVTHTAW